MSCDAACSAQSLSVHFDTCQTINRHATSKFLTIFLFLLLIQMTSAHVLNVKSLLHLLFHHLFPPPPTTPPPPPSSLNSSTTLSSPPPPLTPPQQPTYPNTLHACAESAVKGTSVLLLTTIPHQRPHNKHHRLRIQMTSTNAQKVQ